MEDRASVLKTVTNHQFHGLTSRGIVSLRSKNYFYEAIFHFAERARGNRFRADSLTAKRVGD